MDKNLQILQYQLVNTLRENAIQKRKITTRGRLEPSRLAHYKTSKLLFSQPIPNTGKKYKCNFLLDVSGSMYTSKLLEAIRVLQGLIRLFYGVIDFKITCFGYGMFNMSPGEILSIDTYNIDYDGLLKIFNKRVSKKRINGEDNLIIYEGGENIINSYTFGHLAVAGSCLEMLEDGGDNFIVLLTDGYNQDINIAVNGIDGNKYNLLNYKNFVNDFINQGINILPISIGGDYLRGIYKDYIALNKTSDIYSEVVKFIKNIF